MVVGEKEKVGKEGEEEQQEEDENDEDAAKKFSRFAKLQGKTLKIESEYPSINQKSLFRAGDGQKQR